MQKINNMVTTWYKLANVKCVLLCRIYNPLDDCSAFHVQMWLLGQGLAFVQAFV